MLEGPPQRRRDRPGSGADFHHPPVRIVPHHHPARIARQPLRRSRGNVRAVVQHRLPGLGSIRQDCRVHVDNHLIPFPRRPRVQLVMQGRLRQQGQSIGLLLRPGRGLRCRVGRREGGIAGAAPLVQRLAGRVEGAHEQRTRLRCQAPAKHHGAVLIREHMQGPRPHAAA